MTAVLSASCAAAAAVWLQRPDDWVVVAHRLGPASSGRGLGAPPVWLVAVAATCVAVAAVPSTATQIALLAFVAVGMFALRLRRSARRRAEAAAFRAEVAQVLKAVSAELRAGVDPADALRAAAGGTSRGIGTSGAWQAVHAADAADARTALRSAAATPGGETLADVAAAWHLAEQAGAPLAVILERMAVSLQAEIEVDHEVAAEAEPARATARLMAVLPIFGLGLGHLLGVNAAAVLVGSGLGVTCLVAGLTLACCGVWWIERIVSALDRPG